MQHAVTISRWHLPKGSFESSGKLGDSARRSSGFCTAEKSRIFCRAGLLLRLARFSSLMVFPLLSSLFSRCPVLTTSNPEPREGWRRDTRREWRWRCVWHRQPAGWRKWVEVGGKTGAWLEEVEGEWCSRQGSIKDWRKRHENKVGGGWQWMGSDRAQVVWAGSKIHHFCFLFCLSKTSAGMKFLQRPIRT